MKKWQEKLSSIFQHNFSIILEVRFRIDVFRLKSVCLHFLNDSLMKLRNKNKQEIFQRVAEEVNKE